MSGAQSRAEQKADLRVHLARRRDEMPEAEAQRLGARITRRITALKAWRDARFIHTYVDSLENEVGTRGLIQIGLDRGKRIVVPWIGAQGVPPFKSAAIHSLHELVRGTWGLRQPAEEAAAWVGEGEGGGKFDLVVVPGVAFDRRGHRLGSGGGFYDEFLSRIQRPSVGLTYDEFLLEEIPVEPHDVAVDLVVTETAAYVCGPKGEMM